MRSGDAPTVATSGLQGRVRVMSSEISEWDATAQEWRPPVHHKKFIFDERGRATEVDQSGTSGAVHRTQYHYDAGGRLSEVHAGPAGGQPWITRYSYDDQDRVVRVSRTSDKGVEAFQETRSYDEQGRCTVVESLPEGLDGYGVVGSEQAYGAPGARTQTTYYDEHGRSVQSVFHDAANQIVRRVRFVRDAEGRTTLEESSIGDASPLGESALAQLSPDDREKMLELVRFAFDTISTKFTYNADGLVTERVTNMGRLAEDRHVYQYDEHGNSVLESWHEQTREIGFEDDGTLQAHSEHTLWHETQMTYVYDAHGNWIERVVSSRQSPDAPFTLGNVDRRVIEYY